MFGIVISLSIVVLTFNLLYFDSYLDIILWDSVSSLILGVSNLRTYEERFLIVPLLISCSISSNKFAAG